MKIRKQASKFCIVALALFSFAACEWNGSDKEHFVEVEKPAEEVVDPRVEITNGEWSINPQEVIQIVNDSHVDFDILPKTAKSYSSIDYQIGNLAAYWNGERVNNGWSWSADGGNSFDFRVPESSVNGEVKEMRFELDVRRVLKRKPGSLYDGLTHTFPIANTYNVRVINEDDAIVKNVREEVDGDGFLKLEWDKLDLNVEKILVYSNVDQLLGEVKDLAKPYIIDRNYIGGNRDYNIQVYLKNSLGKSQITTEKAVFHSMLNSDNVLVTENGDKVKFEWQNPNPYPTKYVLQLEDKIYKIPSGKNSIELDRTVVGDAYYALLYSLAVDREDDYYLSSSDYVSVYFSLNNN